MNDSELSVSWGKYRAFLAGIKIRDKQQYDMIKRMGLHEYENMAMDVRTQLEIVMTLLSEQGKMSKFYREAVQDMYSSESSFWAVFKNTSQGTSGQVMPLSVLKKYEEIVHRYNEWSTPMDEMKKCIECGEEKTVDSFSFSRNRQYKRRLKRCRSCIRARKKVLAEIRAEKREEGVKIDPKFLVRGNISSSTGVIFASCGEY